MSGLNFQKEVIDSKQNRSFRESRSALSDLLTSSPPKPGTIPSSSDSVSGPEAGTDSETSKLTVSAVSGSGSETQSTIQYHDVSLSETDINTVSQSSTRHETHETIVSSTPVAAAQGPSSSVAAGTGPGPGPGPGSRAAGVAGTAGTACRIFGCVVFYPNGDRVIIHVGDNQLSHQILHIILKQFSTVSTRSFTSVAVSSTGVSSAATVTNDESESESKISDDLLYRLCHGGARLCVASETGEPDTDFPILDPKRCIHTFGVSSFAIVCNVSNASNATNVSNVSNAEAMSLSPAAAEIWIGTSKHDFGAPALSMLQCAENGDLEQMRFYIERMHVNPNSTTSISISISTSSSIGAGAGPGMDGFTAMHFASCKGHLSMLQYLIKYTDANLDAYTSYGWTPLHMAIDAQQLDTMDLLLQAGCNHQAKTNDGQTCIQLAEKCQDDDRRQAMFKLLEQHKDFDDVV
jgi:Ankyrin repeats (3 copies)